MSPRFTGHFAASVAVAARPDVLFAHLDRQALLAKHMTGSSWMLGGGRMEITADAGEGRALGSHIVMRGTAFGLPLFLDEVVIRYEPPSTKIWQTVGTPRLFVIGNYRMGFHLAPEGPATTLQVFIHYERPGGVGALLGPLYAKWCVKSMLRDAQHQFGSAQQDTTAAPM